MIVDSNTKLADFLFYLEIFQVPENKIEEYFEEIKKYTMPEEYNLSFDELRFRQLIDLQTKIKNFNDLIFVPFETIYDIPKEKVLAMGAFDALKVALFAKDELERITKLFQSIEYKPTPEEERAGIKKLSHGFFGTIDWYARRMGIPDHDTVTEMKWPRIYQCLKIDFDNNNFEKKYRQVISKKQ